MPQGVTKFRRGLLTTLAQEPAQLTELSRAVFQQLYEAGLALEQRLASYNKPLEALCQAHPVGQRLLRIPGVGPLTATA